MNFRLVATFQENKVMSFLNFHLMKLRIEISFQRNVSLNFAKCQRVKHRHLIK